MGYELADALLDWADLQNDEGYARRKAHAVFDVLWESGYMTRGEAYSWMADTGIGEHIADLSPPECRALARRCRREFPWLYTLDAWARTA